LRIHSTYTIKLQNGSTATVTLDDVWVRRHNRSLKDLVAIAALTTINALVVLLDGELSKWEVVTLVFSGVALVAIAVRIALSYWRAISIVRRSARAAGAVLEKPGN
jgi:Ca2+/Na+ antiporter